MNTIDRRAYEGDIVSRLRHWRGLHLAHSGELFEEAANEIARLRGDAQVARLRLEAAQGENATLTVPWSVAASTSHASYYSAPVLPKGFEPIRLDGWMPTSQRLPPDGETVLWYAPEDKFCKWLLGKKEGGGLDWGGDLNSPLTVYTHWRHLPGPPPPSVK